MADHQLAHVYVHDPADIPATRRLLERLDGVSMVLDQDGKRTHGLDHQRSGELVVVAEADRWFSYYWWQDDARAPDYARTVDIHRKPGYDPMEMFLDPELRMPKLRVARRLLQRKLGQRALLDVIPISDTSMIKGSHGILTDDRDDGPLVMTNVPELLDGASLVDATAFKALVLEHVFAI